jgi:hypothetical protein
MWRRPAFGRNTLRFSAVIQLEIHFEQCTKDGFGNTKSKRKDGYVGKIVALSYASN